MSESYDYTPAPWNKGNFKEAEKAYEKHVNDCAKAVGQGVAATNLVLPQITTQAEHPLIIVVDNTASMGKWVTMIFAKLGYFDFEAREYLGNDMQVSFMAVGDANYDKFPFQVTEFGSEAQLAENLKKLVIEGGGGPPCCESYELAMLYCARNVIMPKAIKPIIIFIGDEAFYDYVYQDQAAKWACVQIAEKKILTSNIIEELKRKFLVYIIRKPYGSQFLSNRANSIDMQIHHAWVNALGLRNVALLPDPNRVVDVIFGLLAAATNMEEYFWNEVHERQIKDENGREKLQVILKTLYTVHDIAKLTDGK